MITSEVIRNGGDLMLGYGNYATNELTKKSATQAVDLRRASHNILYTIANSGVYGVGKSPTAEENAEEPTVTETVEVPAVTETPAAPALSNMDQLFRTINIAAGCTLVVLELLLIAFQVLSRKKQHKA